MDTRLITDDKKGLTESGGEVFPQQPAGIRTGANIVSYVFHPVFIPVLLMWFLVYIHPYQFAGFTDFNKMRVMMMSLLMFTFFPVVTVLLLKALKFIDSVYLNTQKDRIIPLVACGVWYFWIWYIWRNSSKMDDALSIPGQAVSLALAVFIASWVGLMANIVMKVSLHTISVGVMITFMTLLALSQPVNFGIYISIALLITGLVCTARFIVSNHTQREVYGGLLAGILSQLVAWWV